MPCIARTLRRLLEMVMYSGGIKVRGVAKGVLAAMCVIMLLQCPKMMNDSETVEDREKGSVAEVTDDSCTVEFTEIVPLDRASDDYHKLEFIDPVVEVKPEDLQDIKQEPADENDNEDVNYSVKQEPADEYETEGQCFTIQVSSLMFQ